MTPYNIHIKKGTDFHLIVEISENGIPVNLENASIEMKVRQDYNEPVLTELSTANSKIKIDEEPGVIHLVLTAAQTAELHFKESIFDVLVTNSYLEVSCVLQGKFLVEKTVTR